MAREIQTLRVLLKDGTLRVPNVPDVSSRRYPLLTKILGLSVELSKGHGSERMESDGNVFWEAKFNVHEEFSILKWLEWHESYEPVNSMEDLFVLPIDTKTKL